MSVSKNFTSQLQYLPPRLTEGIEWYISYYAINPDSGKLKRVKIKLNRIKLISQRRAFAKKYINDITQKLVSGWNPFVKAEAAKSFHIIFNVFDTYLKIQEKESEAHSYRCYKSYIKYLKEYLLRNNYSKEMYVSNFDKTIATNIILEIKENDKYSFRTYNNYLQFFTSLFNWMQQFNYISFNPFSHLKKAPKKLMQKTRTTLTLEQRIQLREFLIQENNNNYLVMCLLCYHCFIRPNEISLLRVRDINIAKQVVYISKEIAKNDTDSVRTMPDSMMEYVRNLKLDYPPDHYLFSRDVHQAFVPGKKRAEGREIARYWSDVVRMKLKWPMSLQFYSLKDTGITNMLDDGIAPNFVQGQADHSSLSITSIYAAKRNDVSQEQIRKKAKCF